MSNESKVSLLPRVVIECEMGPLWATADEFAGMTDEEIVELAHEDVSALLDGATWTVIREEEK